MSAVVHTAEIAAEANATLVVAQTFKITDPAGYEEAGAKLQAIKALSKKIDETFDKHIATAFKAHRDLVAEKKAHQTPLQTAEALIKRAILSYQQAEEQKRLELEAKAQEEARKAREKLEAHAVKAAEKGKVERAETMRAAAAAIIAPTIAPTVQKIAGISTRVTYRAEVVDKLELAEAVVGGRRRSQVAFEGPERRRSNRVPANALDANMPFLNNQARAMKETLAYPGVKVVPETGLASRSA